MVTNRNVGYEHRQTGRCGVLAIATWAAWFWAAQGQLLTKKKEERKGQKGRFNIFAMAGLRTQSTAGEAYFELGGNEEKRRQKYYIFCHDCSLYGILEQKVQWTVKFHSALPWQLFGIIW